MAGYGKLIQGIKAKNIAQRADRGARGIMGDYQNIRAGIKAFSEGVNVLGQVGVSMYKGYSEGQSKWDNIKAGAEEYGPEATAQLDEIRNEGGGFGGFMKSLIPFGEKPSKQGFKSAYEDLFGPGEDTLSKTFEGEGYKLSLAEAGTMGKIVTEGGRRFAKTYDPETKKYKSIQESGWGEKIEGLTEGESLEDNAGGITEGTTPTVESNVTSNASTVEPPKIETPQEVQSEDPSSGVPADKEVKTNSKGQKYYIDDNGQAVIVANIHTGAKYGSFA